MCLRKNQSQKSFILLKNSSKSNEFEPDEFEEWRYLKNC